MQIIHILHHGFSLCDRSEQSGLPRDWPPGHLWVSVSQHAAGSPVGDCPACLQAYEANRSALLRMCGSAAWVP